jgi:transcriptional regulator with XRE-family HTH domain
MKKDNSKPFKSKKKKLRRSDTKVMSKEASLLKFIRESRHLSMRRVAPILGVSEATVNHSENGRRDLDEKLIKRFLKVYGYSWEEFQQMLNGEIEVPDHVRSDCIATINRLEERKLKIVKAFLVTL